jgi:hypothetical protein
MNHTHYDRRFRELEHGSLESIKAPVSSFQRILVSFVILFAAGNRSEGGHYGNAHGRALATCDRGSAMADAPRPWSAALSAEVAANETRIQPLVDTERLDAVLQQILPFAETADALARRTLGKVRTLALLGALAALWIAYTSTVTFEWRLPTLLFAFVITAIPAALLTKIHGMLRATIGLPHRIIECATGLAGKAVEHRQVFENRSKTGGAVERPKFRQLWHTGKSLLDLKMLGDEAKEVAALTGGALVLANPIFAIVLACATAATLVLVAIAAIIGLAYVF